MEATPNTSVENKTISREEIKNYSFHELCMLRSQARDLSEKQKIIVTGTGTEKKDFSRDEFKEAMVTEMIKKGMDLHNSVKDMKEAIRNLEILNSSLVRENKDAIENAKSKDREINPLSKNQISNFAEALTKIKKNEKKMLSLYFTIKKEETKMIDIRRVTELLNNFEDHQNEIKETKEAKEKEEKEKKKKDEEFFFLVQRCYGDIVWERNFSSIENWKDSATKDALFENIKIHNLQNSIYLLGSFYKGKDIQRASDFYSFDKEGHKTFDKYLKNCFQLDIPNKKITGYKKMAEFLNSYPIFALMSWEFSELLVKIRQLSNYLEMDENKHHKKFWSQKINWKDPKTTDFEEIKKNAQEYQKIFDVNNVNYREPFDVEDIEIK